MEEKVVIAGHFGFAAAVKSRRRDIPLAALMLATAWLDVVFIPTLLFGVETVAVAPDAAGPGYAALTIHAWYTHSLVGALVLSAVVAAIFWPRYGRAAAIIIGAVAFSHWLFDLIMHRPDMPLLPDDSPGETLLGFGLWRNPLASAGLELVVVVVGFGLYWAAAVETNRKAGQSTRTANIIGASALIAGITVLAVDFLSPG